MVVHIHAFAHAHAFARQIRAGDLAPVIRLAHALIAQAVTARTSDIHVEATEIGLRICLRDARVPGDARPPWHPGERRLCYVSRYERAIPMLTRRRLWTLTVAATAAVAAPAVPAHAADNPVVVAAAADLQYALTDVAARFTAETGVQTRLIFGSSGNLTRQAEQGAPFEILLSADESYILRLTAEGLTHDAGVPYAEGRIALFAGKRSPLRADAGLDGLRAALNAGTIEHFAIANPEHAPYGLAARQALQASGLWERMRPVLVMGENIGQTMQFAATGAAEGAIVALSLVQAPQARGRGTFAVLPSALHAPLLQRMALLNPATPSAGRLYGYLQSPATRAVLAGYGFTVPETPA